MPIAVTCMRRAACRARWSTCIVLGAWLALAAMARAEVVRDGTMGPAGAINGPAYIIPHTDGTVRGANLFHSFSQFNVRAGESATFTGTASITNVLSRVTGGSASTIDGLLRVTGMPKANFFLINPAGVVFMPGAQLDVPAAFVVTTADEIRLADGGCFATTTDPADTVLTTAPPSAFGFLDDDTASIEVGDSRLVVNEGQGISLVGGDIEIRGRVQARNGRVNLVSAASAGTVAYSASDQTADISVDMAPALGEIEMVNDRIGASGRIVVDGDPGGTVVIRAGRLLVEALSVSALTTGLGDHPGTAVDVQVTDEVVLKGTVFGAAQIAAATFSSGDGGGVRVDASQVSISGGASIALATYGSGDSGRLELSADALNVTDGGWIWAGSWSNTGGRGGVIKITADSLEMAGRASIGTDAHGTGPAGDLLIGVRSLSVLDGSSLGARTSGSAAGGNVVVVAEDALVSGVHPEPYMTDQGILWLAPSIISSESTGGGAAGQVFLTACQLRLLDGGAIAASALWPGSAGGVHVAADHVLISGINATREEFLRGLGLSTAYARSHIASDTWAVSEDPPPNGSAGSAGEVLVEAGELRLTDGGMISTRTETPGAGGHVSLVVGDLFMSHGGRITSASTSTGDAGSIRVEVARDILMQDGGLIATSADVAGGGALSLSAGHDIHLIDSSVTAQAALDGGDVKLTAPNLVRLLNSEITTVAGGSGGNITIDPICTVLDHSRLTADAILGDGGNILIVTGMFLSSHSAISASSEYGVAGTIEITAPLADVAGSLTGLPTALLNAEVRLGDPCVTRFLRGASSFLVTGRDGLPPEPGAWLQCLELPPRDSTAGGSK